MNLEEIQYKFYGLGAVCASILKKYEAETQEGLAKIFDMKDGEKPDHVSLSFTRIVTDHEFLAVKETLLSTSQGPTIQHIAIAASTVIRPKMGTFYSFNAKTDRGLPPSTMLRINGSEEIKVYHATLKIEVKFGTQDDTKTLAKNLYYGKEFILDL